MRSSNCCNVSSLFLLSPFHLFGSISYCLHKSSLCPLPSLFGFMFFFKCCFILQVFAEKMGLEAGWNCHISLQSEHGEVRSLSHGNSGQMSNHPSQASSAGIEQIELDVDGQRVRFKEDSQGNVHEDVETGNERSEDLTVEEVIKQDVSIIDESGGHKTSETEALLTDEISVDVGKEIDELEEKKVKHKVKEDYGCHDDDDDDEDFPPEWCPLLEDDPEHSYLQSNFSNRHRQISETHTCSDGTDVDTTDSVTGFDVSNRVCVLY